MDGMLLAVRKLYRVCSCAGRRDSVVHFVKCDEFLFFTSVCEGLPFKLGQHGLDITVFSCTRNNTGSLVLHRFA